MPMKKVFVCGELMPFITEQRSLLNRGDVGLFTAPTAAEALDLHRKEKFDLIVADMEMPDMGGDEFCSLIRADHELGKAYVVLVCSGNEADLRKCERAGANTFITRPFDLHEIAVRVGRLLELPARRDMRVLVKATVQGKFRQEPFFCSSRNVSASGILVETSKTLARGDRISCSFFLPDTEKVSVEGEVVRVLKGTTSAYSYGVRFVDMTPDAKERIEGFVTAKGKPA